MARSGPAAAISPDVEHGKNSVHRDSAAKIRMDEGALAGGAHSFPHSGEAVQDGPSEERRCDFGSHFFPARRQHWQSSVFDRAEASRIGATGRGREQTSSVRAVNL